jgi:hypothetical protein
MSEKSAKSACDACDEVKDACADQIKALLSCQGPNCRLEVQALMECKVRG